MADPDNDSRLLSGGGENHIHGSEGSANGDSDEELD